MSTTGEDNAGTARVAPTHGTNGAGIGKWGHVLTARMNLLSNPYAPSTPGSPRQPARPCGSTPTLKSCPSIAEYRRATACPDLERQRT
eukprot:5688342-Prorocentrum_lima.AAC.1